MAGWESASIGDICDVVNGGTPKTGVPEYWGGPHRWITPAEMGRRSTPYIDQTDRTITDQGLQNSSARPLPPYSVILSSRAPIGHLVINTEPMATNQGCKGLVPRSRIDHKFLYYYLASIVDLLNELGTGATFKELSGSKLKAVEVPVPPIAEQRRIVAILDEAFEGIATVKAKAEKNLQNARSIFDSFLDSILASSAWQRKTLGELCSGVEYGSSAKSKKEGRIPVLRMGNIQDGRLEWDDLVYTDDEDEITKYLLKEDDVLFNRTNSPELVGKTAIYRGEMPAIFAGYLIRIDRKEELLDADFLCYFLNSQAAIDYGKTVVISSVNQANINGTKLKSYPIPAPSLSEQRIIVAKLNDLAGATRRLGYVYERKVAALDALKRSLLHQAFSGQLTATGTHDLLEAVE
jgi:type I restriction enzyme S subunit